MKTLILKENTPQIREKLLADGIKCCECCDFKAPWLNYNHSITHLVHGVGYPSSDEDTTTEEQRLNCYVKECKDPYYCESVEEFINKIKEQQNLTKEEFFAEIDKAMKQMPSNWRKGQKVFNAVDIKFGAIARIVQFQYGIDCYNKDSCIEQFKDTAYEVYSNPY